MAGLDIKYQIPEVILSSIGNLFGSMAGNILNSENIFKGINFTDNLQSLGSTGVGIGANLLGSGIASLGGNSRLSTGIGNGVSTAVGTIGSQWLSNGTPLFSNTISKYALALKLLSEGKDATEALKGASAINPWGFGMSVAGNVLQGFTGPSKEYGGEYGGITKGMDTAYDAILAAVNFVPGYGQVVSGAMALNKGISNLFGSTSGMTLQDSILGSAFAGPLKWLNTTGSRTTDKFYNSWLAMENSNRFMQNGFGNFGENLEKAMRESEKTYGRFSRGAWRRANNNIAWTNNAYSTILGMADLNELQNIRSQAMDSINTLRYARMINGGYRPIAVGKQGMKVFNNQTNHYFGLRLLSAAALIDNKLMILSALNGTKFGKHRLTKELIEANKLKVYLQERDSAARRAETNTKHAQHYSNLVTEVAETALQNALFEPVTQESLQNSNTEQVKQELLADKNEYFNKGIDFINATGIADLGINVTAPLLQRSFRWAFDKAGKTVPLDYPRQRVSLEGYTGNLLVDVRRPLPKLDMKPFLDDYGREVIPTPWKGTDLELINLILENLVNVLRDYFSPLKKEQIMKAMNWGEKEYSEFLNELIRSIGTLTEGEVKGPKDGFTIIALHKGEALGEGENMTGHHIMTFNRERIPDKKMATEAIIHEIGGHGKTMSINPSKPNNISEAFPRITLLMLKNQELADNILELNGRGKFFSLFPKVSDLELYVYNNNVPKHKVENLFNQRRYFNYMTNDVLERAARAYTGLLMDKLGFNKTLNVQQLERYYTPESVEKFKNAVLNYGVPITVGGSTAATLYNKSK